MPDHGLPPRHVLRGPPRLPGRRHRRPRGGSPWGPCPASESGQSRDRDRILDYALQFPTHGAQRVANELRLQDLRERVRRARGWLRHDLETRTKRLLRLERTAQDDTVLLSNTQIALLERHSVDFRCRHVEASRPGELLNQDTFYWGTLKGVGKLYVQVVVDVFCSLAFAKVCSSKMPVTACELL